MADKEAERIKYKTEVLRLLTVLTVAVGGGSLSLALGELTPRGPMTGTEWFVFGLGVTLLVAVGIFGWALTRH